MGIILITKEAKNKRQLIVIPGQVFDDFFNKHCLRRGFTPGANATCLVTSHNGWKGIPSQRRIVKRLIESIKGTGVKVGEYKYDLPHHLLADIQCRVFDDSGVPIAPHYHGHFKIRFEKIISGKKSLMNFLRKNPGKFGNPGRADKKIQDTYRKMGITDPSITISTFVATHIHVV